MIKLVKWHPFVLFKKIPDCNIPKEMNKYKVKTCWKIIKGTNKLLGVIEAKNILSLVYIPDHLKTKEMSKRAFEEDPYMLDFVPDHSKTSEMCERAVDAYPWALEFVPMDIIITQQMCNKAVKKCAWSWYSSQVLHEATGNMVWGILTCCNPLEPWNYDDKLIKWQNGYRKCKAQKAKIKKRVICRMTSIKTVELVYARRRYFQTEKLGKDN